LQGAQRLELLRLAANRFEALPPWLTDLPSLAWLAWAGNPVDRDTVQHRAPAVSWSDLAVESLLGEGASGQVHRARWRRGDEVETVALKLFKGAMTSDGLPEREMAACLAAGAHPHLTGALGQLVDHPEQLQGLAMPLLPAHWRVLAGPPSRESCSRDVYDPAVRLDLETALRIARAIGLAAAHLHGRGLLHGDLYGHNVLWDGVAGEAVLSDFGAASFLPEQGGAAYQRLEVRAWGLLLGELLDLCEADASQLAPWRSLQQTCTQPDAAARPLLREALEA
jgi:serine/threonine protein kinase